MLPFGPCVTAIAGALAVGFSGVRGGDYPAHLLRAELWERAGVSVWNFHWYGGHPTPSYSVIVPTLVALTGAFVLGAISSIAATYWFGRLVRSYSSSGWAIGGVHLFALCSTVNLVVGRTPFAVGLAAAAGAAWAWRCGRPVAATGWAVLAPLASPVAATFVCIGAAAWLVDAALPQRARPRRSRRSVAIAAAVLSGSALPLVALSFAAGAPGRYPFRGDQVAFSIGMMIVLSIVARDRAVRIAVAMAACVSVMLFAVPNPLGGNFLRFTQFVVIPLAMVAFDATRRRTTIAFAAVIAIGTAWSLQFGAVSTLAWAGDESVDQSYHAPMIDEVRRRNGDGNPVGRLEIPFTENHWEAYYVAAELPFARGWERQVDLERNPELYEPGLTAARYRDWLDRNAVRWIAVPDVELDEGGGPEAELLASGALHGHVRQVWSNANWTLYEVVAARPIVDPPARLLVQRADEIVVATDGPASVTVRYTFVADLSVSPSGCVAAGDDGWTVLTVHRAGVYVLRVDPSSLVAGGDVCDA